MKKELIIFPTSRCIRQAISEQSDGFLATHKSMGEFLERVVLQQGLVTPDDDLRLLALHEACDYEKFSGLNIERSFFTFIQNSTYLFRFFEELSGEMVGIEALAGVDVYGEYEEHIAILQQLWHNYRAIVQSRQWNDPIFSKSIVCLNEGYVKSFESITVHIEGYLSRYEMEVLRQCARLTSLECVYHATLYNEKMSQRWGDLGLEIESGFWYRIDLSQLSIREKGDISPLGTIVCESFQNRLTQVGFVKAKIQEMIDARIEPQKIVVVVPDESFAKYLRLFNGEGNFNFAMGESLGDERCIKDIEAIELFMGEQSIENRLRLDRIPQELITWIKETYHKPFVYDDLKSLCSIMIANIHRNSVKEIVAHECEAFKPLSKMLEGYEFKSALRIFLSRLTLRSIDDVSGGKITVMGLLETRGMVFDGVIVVDFNEGFVPHVSQKDLFLNTQTRHLAGLPTTHERESLQKHYYWMLFDRASKVALCCVDATGAVPSRFLDQLRIARVAQTKAYEEVLFPIVELVQRTQYEYESEYDFCSQPLSPSGLKSFLTCKRQFYYRYIVKIKEHVAPQELSKERDIGTVLHEVMESVYRDVDHYVSVSKIKEAVVCALGESNHDDAMMRYSVALWSERLTPFYEAEIERFEAGNRVVAHEKQGECLIAGVVLAGRMDRVENTLEGLEILDYKTGKFVDTTKPSKEEDVDYQLAAYALMGNAFGKISRCGFYDLKTGKIAYEQFLDDKIERLKAIVAQLSHQKKYVWEQSQSHTPCRYCPYAILCQREG